MVARPADSPIESYARGAAALLGIEISEEDWPAVTANLEVLRVVAAVLLVEPIADDIPLAPVFEA